MTLTNPVENLTHVTLLECEEGDPDNINSTAKVRAFVPTDPDITCSGFTGYGLKESMVISHFYMYSAVS